MSSLLGKCSFLCYTVSKSVNDKDTPMPPLGRFPSFYSAPPASPSSTTASMPSASANLSSAGGGGSLLGFGALGFQSAMLGSASSGASDRLEKVSTALFHYLM